MNDQIKRPQFATPAIAGQPPQVQAVQTSLNNLVGLVSDLEVSLDTLKKRLNPVLRNVGEVNSDCASVPVTKHPVPLCQEINELSDRVADMYAVLNTTLAHLEV